MNNEVEALKSRIEKYRKLDNIQSDFSELSDSVTKIDEKMNSYVKNFILIKTLSKWVTDLQEKVKKLEKTKMQ